MEKLAVGTTLLRSSYNDDKLEDLSKSKTWGTMGPEGKGPRQFLPLCELETDHLENILITQRHISFETSLVILFILKDRYINQF
jgi:hypothetical protein